MVTTRLATSNDAESDLNAVIYALKREKKEYIYWGNNRAEPADFIFVHSKKDRDVIGILKVLNIKERSEITKEGFLSHRPQGWSEEMTHSRYYLIIDAIVHKIIWTELNDGNGQPLKAWHDMNFVTSHQFAPF